jgi:hypothetical protein
MQSLFQLLESQLHNALARWVAIVTLPLLHLNKEQRTVESKNYFEKIAFSKIIF